MEFIKEITTTENLIEDRNSRLFCSAKSNSAARKATKQTETFIFVLVCLALFTISFSLFQPVYGQKGSIVVGDIIHVSGEKPAVPYVEPFLAVNPADSRHIVCAAIEIEEQMRTAVFVSTDGGLQWKRHTFKRSWLDPWIAFGPDSTVYVATLEYGDRVAILLYRSTDKGRSWNDPLKVPFLTGKGPTIPTIEKVASYDHESIIIDRWSKPFSNSLYLVAFQAMKMSNGKVFAAPVFLKSSDGGVTFSDPLRMVTNNIWANVLNVLVFHQGEVGFGYSDFAVDEGETMKPLENKRIWWVRSDDGGKSFSVPYLVAEVREATTHPVMAVDHSTSLFNDQIYLAVDDRIGGTPGIFVYRSADKGELWSGPIKVTDTLLSAKEFANPVVAVNGNGVVGVAWYDGRNAAAENCWDIYFSASTDGGKTFLPNVRVTGESFCTAIQGNVVKRGEKGDFNVAKRWPVGGDYFGIDSDGNETFSLVWADSRSGVYQLWYTTINVQQ